MLVDDELYNTILALFNDRAQEWLDSSIEIANAFSPVWEALEDHLATRFNILNIGLANLVLNQSSSPSVTYHVVSKTSGHYITATFGVDVLINADSADSKMLQTALEKYVEVFDNAEMFYKQVAMEQSLINMSASTPGLFIDIKRMVEIETLAARNKLIQGMPPSTVQ